jgi:gamma-glutamylcyclotransferase (GGCT)/AIG2-like uncharacterized protein YtfP
MMGLVTIGPMVGPIFLHVNPCIERTIGDEWVMDVRSFRASPDGPDWLVDVQGHLGCVARGSIGGSTSTASATGYALDARGEEVSVAILSDVEPFVLDRVFVYGTLRRGGRWHSLLVDHSARQLCVTRVGGQLVDLGAYPGFVRGEGWVHGEVWRRDAPASLLSDLDELEDFLGYGRGDSEYRRIIIDTPSGPAWTYLHLRPEAALGVVEGGDWMRR